MNGEILSRHSLPTSAGMLHYALRRSSRRRTIEVRLLESSEIAVAAPHHTSLEKIQAFIYKHADWLVRKQIQIQNRLLKIPERRYEDGQKFLFLGKEYPLQVRIVSDRQARMGFDGQSWLVSLPEEEAADSRPALIKKKLLLWYRAQAEEIFGGRVFHYGRILGATPETIVVKTQKRMWGNCHYRSKKINLNWRLVMAPMPVIDYVVVHELCHLEVPNHSSRFWRQVMQILPTCNVERQWLKKNAALLALP
jgi:predicted metal-dependent hydrolase